MQKIGKNYRANSEKNANRQTDDQTEEYTFTGPLCFAHIQKGAILDLFEKYGLTFTLAPYFPL